VSLGNQDRRCDADAVIALVVLNFDTKPVLAGRKLFGDDV